MHNSAAYAADPKRYLSPQQVLHLLKNAELLDRVENATQDLSAVRASIDLQSAAADFYADIPGSAPISVADTKQVLTRLAQAYAKEEHTPDLPALKLFTDSLVKTTQKSPSGLKPMDFVDGIVVGVVSADLAASQKTFFARVTHAALGVLIGVAGVQLAHFAFDKLFSPQERAL